MLPSELGRSWVWQFLLAYLEYTLCFLSEFCRWANGAILQMSYLLIRATGLSSLADHCLLIQSEYLLLAFLQFTQDLVLISFRKLALNFWCWSWSLDHANGSLSKWMCRDEDWQDNDGALNTISMTYPRLPIEHPNRFVLNDSDCQPLQPGIWFVKIPSSYDQYLFSMWLMQFFQHIQSWKNIRPDNSFTLFGWVQVLQDCGSWSHTFHCE